MAMSRGLKQATLSFGSGRQLLVSSKSTPAQRSTSAAKAREAKQTAAEVQPASKPGSSSVAATTSRRAGSLLVRTRTVPTSVGIAPASRATPSSSITTSSTASSGSSRPEAKRAKLGEGAAPSATMDTGIDLKPGKDVPLPEELGSTYPPVRPSKGHTCLCEPSTPAAPDVPKPLGTALDIWDSYHVRMPTSRKNQYVDRRHDTIENRWTQIAHTLTTLPTPVTSAVVERVVLRFNPRYKGRWNFKALHKYCRDETRRRVFERVVPRIAALAVKLPDMCPAPIPLLSCSRNHSITLSQAQIACLLANAFFCTFPRRNSKKGSTNLPSINFNSLFASFSGSIPEVAAAKLNAVLNYFDRVTTELPGGVLTFHRQSIADDSLPSWDKLKCPLTRMRVYAHGTIEDHGVGMSQADFANKMIGGGVLGRGAVQEEIRFLICPELIVSRLFTEVLLPHEALIITGAEQFSKYTGYAGTFRFAGNHVDKTPRDEWGRRQTQLVAIDALVFRGRARHQYDPQLLCRELNKAYAGLWVRQPPREHRGRFPTNATFATGNWGCGAFGGDPHLKAIIQWLAASAAERNVVYFTFQDHELQKGLAATVHHIHQKGWTVADVYAALEEYAFYLLERRQKRVFPLLAFITLRLDGHTPQHDDDDDDDDDGDDDDGVDDGKDGARDSGGSNYQTEEEEEDATAPGTVKPALKTELSGEFGTAARIDDSGSGHNEAMKGIVGSAREPREKAKETDDGGDEEEEDEETLPYPPAVDGVVDEIEEFTDDDDGDDGGDRRSGSGRQLSLLESSSEGATAGDSSAGRRAEAAKKGDDQGKGKTQQGLEEQDSDARLLEMEKAVLKVTSAKYN